MNRRQFFKGTGLISASAVLLPRIPFAADAAKSAAKPPMMWGDSTRLGRPFAKDPSVIRCGGRYLLYFSMAPWAKELAPPNASRGWAIGIAESRDLVNWKKVGDILPEQEVLNLLSAGYLYKEISDQLGIGIETVRTYVKNICEKMHVRNRVEAVAKHGGKAA